MKMIVKATLKAIHRGCAKIGVEINHDFDDNNLISEFYIAMLKGMRNSHEDEFHAAMINFISEELDNV